VLGHPLLRPRPVLRLPHPPPPRRQQHPAGFQCLTLTHATPSPGLTTAQVFAAIRRVRLPGGAIGAVPEVRGLANLESFFYLQGATQPPGGPAGRRAGGARGVPAGGVPVGVRRRAAAGDHRTRQPEPAQPGATAFRRRGRYRVGGTVVWTAQAFLGGRRVGQVEELVSRAATSYPVAEIRTTLTG
jgi:hypothetical protein